MPRLRLFLALLGALATLGASCSDGGAAVAEREVPTPRAAPAIDGTELDDVAVPAVTDEVAVIGLAGGESLDIHALPGLDQPVIGMVPAGAADVIVLGDAFETADGVTWWLVRYESTQGWVQPEVAFVGATRNSTGRLQIALGDRGFDDLDALAIAVAEEYAATATDAQIAVVSSTTAPPRVTVDVVGFDDDAVAGVRLIVVGAGPAGRVQVESVQEIPLCRRGVTVEGLCT